MATAPARVQDSAITSALAGEGLSGFDELYREHYERVYSLCLRMTRNPADAEDLAQEVFILLARKLPQFRGDAAFTTWLHRIVVSQALMSFRKRKKREQVTPDGDMPEKVDEGVDHDLRLDLEAAIAALPSGYRNALILHDVEGYEHEELAKIVGWTAGTSKSQLFKARRKMQKLLA